MHTPKGINYQYLQYYSELLVGKRLLIEQICKNNNLLIKRIEPALVFLSGGQRTSFDCVNRIFIDATARSIHSPTVLIIERCHELVPEKCSEIDLVSLISSWLRNLYQSKLLVVATTCEESLHSVWKSFDIELSVPMEMSRNQRLELLQFFDPNASESSLQAAALHSGGFMACDLSKLCPLMGSIDEIQSLISNIRKSLGSSHCSIDTLTWDQVIGQEDAKRALKQMSSFLTCHESREKYKSRGLVPPRGIIMYGPPGTGKTLLARAAASTFNVHFISVSIPSVIHAPVGESEKAIRNTFLEAARLQPSIVFFDEIDSIVATGDSGSISEKIAMQLAEEFDGLADDSLILVIAATNLPQNIHPSLRRFGRLDLEIFVGPLSASDQVTFISKELYRVGIIKTLETVGPEMEKRLALPRTGAQVSQIIDRIKYRFLHDQTIDVESALVDELGVKTT